MIPILVPVGLAVLGYGGYKYMKKKPTYAPNAVAAVPNGYAAPAEVQHVSSPVATYTFVPNDLSIMVARRFTFDRAEFDAANPNFYNQHPAASKTASGMLFSTKAFPPGTTINLPPRSMDNGPREMAMGNPMGIVSPGITKQMIPNAPGVTDIQSSLIRETLAMAQKNKQAQTQTADQISHWLNTITR